MKRNGFTLIELIVVIVIIGIIASFAVPGYQKTITRARAKDAVLNMMAIDASEQVYKSMYGNFWPDAVGQDVDDINENLGLNIVENGMTYSCWVLLGTGYVCTATSDDSSCVVSTISGSTLTCTEGCHNPPDCTTI